MHGGGHETIAPDLGDEYAARFGLRDLVEAWMDRVVQELPNDPYQLLMDEAVSQRQLGGGVVTCPNAWCGMSMPGYSYEVHRSLCNAQEHWTRCVRCNKRIEAARLSTHLTTCRAEPCRFCGGLSLPRMMHLCPIQQLFEADRATNALHYRRHRQEALEWEAATAAAGNKSAARCPIAPSPISNAKRIAGGGEHSPNEGAALTVSSPAGSPSHHRIPPPPPTQLSRSSLPASPVTRRPASVKERSGERPSADASPGAGPSTTSGDAFATEADTPMPTLTATQQGHLTCIQRLWRRHMVSERYRASMLSRVWESLDMYEERMGVSQSLDGGGFLEGVVESLNASVADGEQDDLDDALAQSYNHPISSVASSYGDEDDTTDARQKENPTRARPQGLSVHSVDTLAQDDSLDGEDGAQRLQRKGSFTSTGTGVSGATTQGADLSECSFRGVVRRQGSFAVEEPEAMASEVDDEEEDDDGDHAADAEGAHYTRVGGGRASAMTPRHVKRQRQKPQQLWLRVSTTPDVSGAYMTEEGMQALTRLSGHREVFRASLVVAIVRAATRILLERPVVVRVTTPPRGMLVVVGDLHGQMKDLLHLLRITGGPSPTRYFVFNGDLVDRGPYGCEVIVHVLALLCTYPRYVFINRGNHEDRRTNQEYGFLAELFGKYGVKSSRIHRILADSYTAMPLMTIVDQRYCIVHGGVPRDDCTLQDIEDIGRVKHIPVVEQKTRQDRLLVDLLWNDPVEKYQSRQIGERHQGNGWRSSKRGCGAEYLLNITSRFLRHNGLSMVIRSHDVKPGGFETVHNSQCVTVFSASNYAGVSGNRGAIAILQSESKYPTYQTWLLQKDTVVARRASVADADGGGGVSHTESVDDELADPEDLLEEDPRTVRDEYIRSFYGENALIELVKAYVDFHTDNASPRGSLASQRGSVAGGRGSHTSPLGANQDSSSSTFVTKPLATFRLASVMTEPTMLQQLKTIRMLRDLIYLHRYSLLAAFNSVDEMRTGVVYKVEWCVVMREVTDLDVPWYYLCQFLAPRLVLDGIPAVEYVRFLRHYDAPFAHLYRPAWQRHIIRRTFADLDLPEDILRAFRLYDDPGSDNNSTGSHNYHQQDRGSAVVTNSCTSQSQSQPSSSRQSTPALESLGKQSSADRQRGAAPTSVPSPRSGEESVSPNHSPTTPAPVAAAAAASTSVDISTVMVDFVTFASRIRSLSPITATFEDSELYCLFRFFDVDMRGHVYLEDFIDQVNAVLNDDDEDDGSAAELILSGEELDFGSVTGTDHNRKRPASSSSSSSDSDAPPMLNRASPAEGARGGLLARTSSNVMAMRGMRGPPAAPPPDPTPSTPPAVLGDSDDEACDDEAKNRLFRSTDTRPFDSASVRHLPTTLPVEPPAALPSAALCSPSESSDGSISSLLAGGVGDHVTDGGSSSAAKDPSVARPSDHAAPSGGPPAEAPLQPLGKRVGSRRSDRTETTNTIVDADEDDAPIGIRKHIMRPLPHNPEDSPVVVLPPTNRAAAADEGRSSLPRSQRRQTDVSSMASSLPTWDPVVYTPQTLDVVKLATASTEEAIETLRQMQEERITKLPWLYPTLIRVQEQLMHRGSEERTYRVFRALNRNHDGRLTRKEFWALIRFSNTRLNKPVTEEQSDTIFQCIHDDNLLRVQIFCDKVMRQLEGRESLAQSVPTDAPLPRTDTGESSSALPTQKSTILLTRLRDEARHGMSYITALEFVSFFSVVVADEAAEELTPTDTKENTMASQELNAPAHGDPSNSESYLDPVHLTSSFFARMGSVDKTNGAAGPPAGAEDAGRPLSHSACASSGSLGQHNSRTNRAEQQNHSTSSRSLSVAGPLQLPRRSFLSSNYAGSTAGRLAASADAVVPATLEYLATFFPADTTLEEMMNAFATANTSGADLSFNSTTATARGNTAAVASGAGQTPGYGYRPFRSIVGLQPTTFNSNLLLAPDPLADSWQGLSTRPGSTATILSTPMPMQPAEHRVTSNALHGTGGFGQSGVTPRRGRSTVGGHLGPMPRVSTVTLGFAAAPAKVPRPPFTVPSPPPPAQTLARRGVSAGGGSSASSWASSATSPREGSRASTVAAPPSETTGSQKHAPPKPTTHVVTASPSAPPTPQLTTALKRAAKSAAASPIEVTGLAAGQAAGKPTAAQPSSPPRATTAAPDATRASPIPRPPPATTSHNSASPRRRPCSEPVTDAASAAAPAGGTASCPQADSSTPSAGESSTTVGDSSTTVATHHAHPGAAEARSSLKESSKSGGGTPDASVGPRSGSTPLSDTLDPFTVAAHSASATAAVVGGPAHRRKRTSSKPRRGSRVRGDSYSGSHASAEAQVVTQRLPFLTPVAGAPTPSTGRVKTSSTTGLITGGRHAGPSRTRGSDASAASRATTQRRHNATNTNAPSSGRGESNASARRK